MSIYGDIKTYNNLSTPYDFVFNQSKDIFIEYLIASLNMVTFLSGKSGPTNLEVLPGFKLRNPLLQGRNHIGPFARLSNNFKDCKIS